MEKNVLYNGAIRLLKSIKLCTTLNKDKDSMVTFVPEPEGTLEIVGNGTGIDVKEKAYVNVNVPEPGGTLVITENGTGIDVKKVAYVNVNVQSKVDLVIPTIAVSDNGTITVSGNNITTTSYTLSSEDDSDFVAGNIMKGKTIFGLTGTAEGASSFTAVPIEVKTSTTEYTLDGTTITPDSYGSFAFPLMGNGLYWFNYITGMPGNKSSVVSRFLVAKYVKTNYLAYKTRKNNPTEFSAVSGATVTGGGNYLYFKGTNTTPFYAATYQGFYLPLTNFNGQTEV